MSEKALILISVPLAFELCFVFLVIQTSRELDDYLNRSQRAWRYSLLIHRQLTTISDIGNALIAMVIQRAPDTEENFELCVARLPALKRELAKLGAADAPPNVNRFHEVADQILQAFTEVGSMDAEVANPTSYGAVKTALVLINRLHQLSEEFLSEESKELAQHDEVEHQLRQRLNILVVTGVIESLLLALGLALAFDNSTTSRLSVVSRNIESMKSGEPFVPELTGNDEISDIDSTFRALAHQINTLRANEQALTENVSDTICSINRFGMIQQFNPAALELFGATWQTLQNQSLFNLLPPAERDLLKGTLESARAQGTVERAELVVETREQTQRNVSFSFRWSEYEELFYVMGHDISEQKRLEMLKQELFDMVSHDIRAPLGSIKLILDLVSGGNFGKLSDDGLKRVAMADYSLARLVNLTNDLLTVEKYAKEGISLDLSKQSVRQMAASATHILRVQIDQKRITINYETEDNLVECDKERIAQVFLNILDNAVKYTRAGGNIRIGSVTQDNGFVKVWLQDDGRGIPLEKQAIIFDRFKQANRGDENINRGSGLGLAIAKSIVSAHHGEIGVSSQPGSGSTFWFTLRAAI